MQVKYQKFELLSNEVFSHGNDFLKVKIALRNLLKIQ